MRQRPHAHTPTLDLRLNGLNLYLATRSHALPADRHFLGGGGALHEWNALISEAVVDGAGGCCGALSHIYSSQVQL